MGSQNLAISEDAVFVNITKVSQHPLYDNKSSYFDVAVLEVEPLQLSEVRTSIAVWKGTNFIACSIIEYTVPYFLSAYNVLNELL